MKKILILVLSADFHPYDRMVDTSLETWDSVNVEGCETVYYFGESKNNRTGEKFVYFPIREALTTMGYKTLMAFEWALENKDFDYIARVHSSTYVDKKQLIEYVKKVPDENVFAGAVADSVNGFKYLWGGAHYLISKDVIKRIVENKKSWNHFHMEDESMSLVVSELGVQFSVGKSGSIDKMPTGWRCISYGGETISFKDFSELIPLKHHYFRVKHDLDRSVDEKVMRELFKVLQ